MRRNSMAIVAAGALSAAPAAFGQVVEPDVIVLHSLGGESGADTYGWAAADLGDLDGDGAREFAVSAPTSAAGGANAGRVYVYSGRTGAELWRVTGAAGEQLGWSIASAGDVTGDGVEDVIAGGIGGTGVVRICSGVNGSLVRTIAGTNALDRFGFSVSRAGDVDGDGVEDQLVGATGYDGVGTNSGRAYVCSGATGLVIRTYEGEGANNNFGSAIAALGDADGDGKSEHIVGARNAGRTQQGKTYVFSGATGALVRAHEPDPTEAADLGWFFVAGVGDIDGDGAPDVYAADQSDGNSRGKVYVWSGATGALLRLFRGPDAGDGAGPGRGAGDADGDGTPDLLIGCWINSALATNAGRVYLVSGRNGSVLRTFTSATAGETLGFDAVGIGDVNADGIPDFVLTGVNTATAGTAYVVSGAARVCPGDLNGDGQTNAADLATLLGSWGGCP